MGEVDTDALVGEFPDAPAPDSDTPKDADAAPSDAGLECEGPVDARLATGVVSLTANLQALPIWLHLYLDLEVDPLTGELAGIGTNARLQMRDPPLAPDYDDPETFEVRLDDTGWAFYFDGCATSTPADQLELTSAPVDLRLTVLGSVPVLLENLVIQAVITSRANEREVVSGILTTTGGSFGDPPTRSSPSMPRGRAISDGIR